MAMACSMGSGLLEAGPAGSVSSVRFQLIGREFMAFNGGNYFGKFHESVSVYVNCETQEEVDALWEKLSAGGEEQQCGGDHQPAVTQ